MDDAERIPIDLGYDVAAEAAQPSDPRVQVQADGSVVIDILAPPPCAAEPSTDDEIVVCAEAPEGGLPSTPPPAPTANEQISNALHAKIGPLEVGSIRKRDGTYAFGARVRF
jgi:hypothetical protein